jgi:iron complex outermembrane receptor protein
MSLQRTKLATALGWAAGAAAAMSVCSAHAQSAPDIRVEVTGSNIKRVEGEGALPVTVITRQEIERSGATTPMELLQQLSANNSAGMTTLSNGVGALTFSAQTASLRGLGGARTLVLINGNRIDSFSGEVQGVGGVNLAAIPFNAIERVEILKDGASAIYGSDAIAGVINFITRNDYTGVDASGFYGTPTRGGGGDQWQGTVSAGWGDLTKDRWNAFLSASYNEQKPLDQAARNFSRSSYIPDIGLIGISSNTNPGNITTGGIGVVNNSSGTPIVASNPQQCGRNQYYNDENLLGCYFDPSMLPGVQMIGHQKTTNLFASARFQVNNDWQAYVTGLYSRDEVNLVIQPGPVSSLFPYGPLNNIPSTITLQPTSPFYPHAIAAEAGVDGEPLDIRYRTFDNGFRDTTDTNENWQIVGGVKGRWHTWDVDAAAFYSEGTNTQRINGGFQDLTRLLPILNSGVVNFFGPNTPDVIELERSANFVGDVFNGKTKNYGARATASTDLYKMPAGPLAFAFGVEARKEEFDQIANPALEEGNITGFGGPIKSTRGKDRKQWATFAELNVPIVKNLEADVALRYDHYSDFGSTTNPKFSLRWQPLNTLLLRGSYGTGFLAPSLYELYTPQFAGVTQTGQTDPVRCPVTNDTGLDCSTQFGLLYGGNAALKPEESEQATFGVVFEPIPNLSFSLDYFKINLKNAIVNGIAPPVVLGDLNQFGGLVTRGPEDPNFPGLPGRIQLIDQTYINLGAIRIQGVDIDARYRAPVQPWGRVSFSLSGTYYLRYDAQNPDGSYTGAVGTALGTVVTGIVPRWKHYATATWEQGPWSATIAQTYQTSYTDQQPDLDGNPRTVGSMSIWDLQGTYSGFKNWKFALGVKNLFDRDPPKSNQQTTFILGFDPSYYDPRGRFVYTTVSYSFK